MIADDGRIFYAAGDHGDSIMEYVNYVWAEPGFDALYKYIKWVFESRLS
jgi:hypothetical protein